MPILVKHPIENQMFTSTPVGDRMRGTAIRVSITDGEHTLVEEGAPTNNQVQNSARLAQLESLLENANKTISELVTAVGIKVPAPVASTPAPIASSAPATTEPTVDELKAQLAAAEAKVAGSGTEPYVAS